MRRKAEGDGAPGRKTQRPPRPRPSQSPSRFARRSALYEQECQGIVPSMRSFEYKTFPGLRFHKSRVDRRKVGKGRVACGRNLLYRRTVVEFGFLRSCRTKAYSRLRHDERWAEGVGRLKESSDIEWESASTALMGLYAHTPVVRHMSANIILYGGNFRPWWWGRRRWRWDNACFSNARNTVSLWEKSRGIVLTWSAWIITTDNIITQIQVNNLFHRWGHLYAILPFLHSKFLGISSG